MEIMPFISHTFDNPTVFNYRRFYALRSAVVDYCWSVFGHFYLFIKNNGCQNNNTLSFSNIFLPFWRNLNTCLKDKS